MVLLPIRNYMKQPRLFSIMSGTDRSVAGNLVRLGLGCIEPAYRTSVEVRNMLFNYGLRSSHKLGRPTISVGNLVTGGTGKTPVVIELARRFEAMNIRAAVLLRGYRTGPSGSDEALELAEELGPKVPIEANPDRVAGSRHVIAAHPDVEVFLLDDGFQHRQVHRDLDLVLIDAHRPFGFDRVLPRGLLREPAANLSRADAVIVTRADRVPPNDLAHVDQAIAHLTGQLPLAHAAHRWLGYRDHNDQHHRSDVLRQARVLGVCGLAQPDTFEQTLREEVQMVKRSIVLADHHQYTRDQVWRILEEAHAIGCDAAVTSEKDWVKWRSFLKQGSLPLPVFRPVLRLVLLDGQDALDALLRQCVRQRNGLSLTS